MAATEAQLARLVESYQQALIRLAAGAEAMAEQGWRWALRDGDEALQRIAGELGIARRTAADLAATFADTYIAAATDGAGPATAVDLAEQLDRLAARRGPMYRDQLRRLEVLVDAGQTPARALAETGPAVGQLADGDVVLAAREGFAGAMTRHPEVTAYRRHPEPTACRFCREAATRTYYVADLRPIHQHCHCVTVPAPGVPTRGRTVGKGTLRRTVAA